MHLRTAASLLASVLAATTFAGCAELGDIDIQTIEKTHGDAVPVEETAEITVGRFRYGDEFTFSSSSTSHQADSKESHDRRFTMSISGPFLAYDRFLRPVDAVTEEFRYPSTHDHPDFQHSVVMDAQNKRPIYVESSYLFSSESTNCSAYDCTTDRESGIRHYRQFATGPTDDPHPFEGLLLTLGQKISFESHFWDAHHGVQTTELHYVVDRFDDFEGTPVAVVARVLDDPEAGLEELWFSQDIPVPVKSTYSVVVDGGDGPVRVEDETVLEEADRGDDPIPWEYSSAVPHAHHDQTEPVSVLLSRPTPTHYSLDRAWHNIQSDPTLVQFLASGETVPSRIDYSPDADAREWTWSFHFQDLVVETRLSEILGIEGVQNQEYQWCCFASERAIDRVIPFTTVLELNTAIKQIAIGMTPTPTQEDTDVAIDLDLTSAGQPFPVPWEGYVLPKEPTPEFPYGGIHVDPKDGGLLSFGDTWHYRNMESLWLAPWVPIIR